MLAILIIFFLLILIFSLGLQRTFQILPVIIIFGLLFLFLGWFALNFFWVIILIWFIRKITSPQKTRKTYYRTYTSQNAEDIFKEFFRQNGFNYQNYSYQQNYGRSNFENWTVNKDEYYKELGVDKNCTKEELRKAYLKKVKENHPDKFSNANAEEKKYHEDKLKKINEAYDNLLKDFS